MLRNSTKKGKAKPKKDLTWKGKKYKSPLEVFTAQQLELAGLPNHYEEWKVPLMEKFTCTCPSWEVQEKTIKGTDGKKRKEKNWVVKSPNVQKMHHAPDFPCSGDPEEIKIGWVIEVKGHRTDSFNDRFRLMKSWMTEQGWTTTMYMPTNQAQVVWCINHIKENL